MKLHTKLLAASVLAMSITSVFAANSTQLKVAGKIDSGPCSIVNPGVLSFDFGNIPYDINQQYKFLDITPAVLCPGLTQIAIKIVDNNSTGKPTIPFSFFFGSFRRTLGPNRYYGLIDDSGKSIGAWTMVVYGIEVDGDELPIQLSDDGKTWLGIQTDVAIDNRYPYMAPYASRLPTGNIKPGTNFRFPMTVGISFPKDNFANANIHGSATFELISL